MLNDPNNNPTASVPPSLGSVFISHRFWPFFFAGIWTGIAAMILVLAFAGASTVPTAFDPIAWHAYEMVFGYAAAAIAGFLFTAPIGQTAHR